MIARQWSRLSRSLTVRGARLPRDSGYYLKTARLVAGFGACDKLHHQNYEFEKVVLYNSRKVVDSFTGSSQLLPMLTLLSSTYSIREPRRYNHTLELLRETCVLLEALEKNNPNPTMEVGGALVDCLAGLAHTFALSQEADTDSEKKELAEQIQLQELQFLQVALRLATKCYVKLNVEEKELLKAALNNLNPVFESLPEVLRVEISNTKKHLSTTDLLGSQAYTEAFLSAFGLKGYMKTESPMYTIEATNNLSRSSPQSRLRINHQQMNSTLDVFTLSDTDIKGQTLKLGKHFSDAEKLQSLCIDSAPLLNPQFFGNKDPHKKKMYEYSQYLVKDWPYLYKFEGRAALRGYYYQCVFDREFFTEKERLLYYKMHSHNEVFDAWSSVKALFMGEGDRPKIPRLYLGGLVGEERVVAAMAGLGGFRHATVAQTEQMLQMAGAFHVVCGLRTMIDAKQRTGCHMCGEGENLLHEYYNRCEKISGGVGRGPHEGKVGAGVAFECFEKLDEGHSGVVGWSEGMMDYGLPELLEMLRQKRFGVEHSFKREHWIKGIFSDIQEKEKIDSPFMQKLALVENTLGIFDTTINQFTDLLANEQLLMAYELKKEQLASQDLMLEWNPGYVDTMRDVFCAVENCILPVRIDDSKYDYKLAKVWEVEDKNQKEDFFQAVEKKLDQVHKVPDPIPVEQPVRGRKIKSKLRVKEEQDHFQLGLQNQDLQHPKKGSEKPVSILRQKKEIQKALRTTFGDSNYDIFDNPTPKTK